MNSFEEPIPMTLKPRRVEFTHTDVDMMINGNNKNSWIDMAFDIEGGFTCGLEFEEMKSFCYVNRFSSVANNNNVMKAFDHNSFIKRIIDATMEQLSNANVRLENDKRLTIGLQLERTDKFSLPNVKTRVHLQCCATISVTGQIYDSRMFNDVSNITN